MRIGSPQIEAQHRMRHVLAAFRAKYPTIKTSFIPIRTYDSILNSQIKKGVAPDIFYLRPFSSSRQLFDRGYIKSLEDLVGLKDNFTPEVLEPWTSADGKVYGVPVMATSYGIYCNIDLFKKLGLEVPTTWEQLLATAETLQNYGYIPFANGLADEKLTAELMFMNVAPNFIGGREGRLKYLKGDRCFNDPRVRAAFQAMADLKPFLSEEAEQLSYYDSKQLFIKGEAAMFMGGSWDIPFFEAQAQAPEFEWSVFAVPAPEGMQSHVTFHPEFAFGLNQASVHKREAKLLLAWLSSEEAAELFAAKLPGLFPMHKQIPEISNRHAKTFLSLNEGRGTDVLWASSILQSGSPDAYSLMQEGAVGVLRGEMTPTEAADNLQKGLATWFEPAQKCAPRSGSLR